jgi:gliding motility-associated-like protein
VCSGNTTTLKVTLPQTGITYKWYGTPALTTVLGTGSSYITDPITATTNFYVAAFNTAGCSSANAAQVQVTIAPPPAAPIVANGATVQGCVGAKVTLSIDNPTAGFTYNWYSTATSVTPLSSGVSFVTTTLTTDVSYYAEAVNTTGCGSSTRTKVDIHVNLLPAAPTITADGGSTTPSVCSGNSAKLTATSATLGVTFNWYDVPNGVVPVYTGAVYNTPPISGITTYYVEAVSALGGCASSTRTPVQITINNNSAPTPAVDAAGLTICQNSPATISITNPDAGTTYNFYSLPVGGASAYTGTSFVTPGIAHNTTYYVEATNPLYCKPSARLAVNLIIVPQPDAPVPTAPTVQVCKGGMATLAVASPQPTLTYHWYDSATKTTLLFTGPIYVAGPVNVSATYYVEASNGSCNSSALASVKVNVNGAPGAPLLVNNALQDCQGDQVTLSISNPQPGFTYKWYANAQGGNALYTGVDFLSPQLSGTTTYYAEAINGTNCPSVTRTSATVTVTASPEQPQVSSAGTSICPGLSTTLNATTGTAGATIKWYADATGGTALSTGNSFGTPPLSANTTYYAEAVSATGNCLSPSRTAVTVFILQPLPAPVPSVGTTTISSVAFEWGAVSGATGYEVSLDNGNTFSAPSSGSNGLSHVVTGLKPDQSVTIIVRAIGATACELSANSAAVTGTSTNPLGDGIYIPNAFTPNGDGNNDVLMVYGNVIQSIVFSIYDQWGELQFKTTNKDTGWDGTYKGTRQPVGVYVYYLEVTTKDNQVIKKKGTVTLLR